MPKSNVTPYTIRTPGGKIVTKVHQSLLAGTAALALLVLAACAGSDPGAAPDTTTTSTSDPATTAQATTTTLSTQDEVEQMYLEFVAMLDRITTTTVDPNDPELAERMVDPALGGFRTQLSTWQAQGQIWLAGDQSRHDVERVVVTPDGMTAEVTDCVVANDALVGVGTPSVPFPPPRTDRGVTTMLNQNGRWMVSETEVTQHWDGVAGCAA